MEQYKSGKNNKQAFQPYYQYNQSKVSSGNMGYDLYVAEAEICDRYNHCEIYHLPLLKKRTHNIMTMQNLATKPTKPADPTKPDSSNFGLKYATNEQPFYFIGNSDANFEVSNTVLTARSNTNIRYYIYVTFPYYDAYNMPSMSYLEGTLAEMIVTTTFDKSTYDMKDWSWTATNNLIIWEGIIMVPAKAGIQLKDNGTITSSGTIKLVPIPDNSSTTNMTPLAPTTVSTLATINTTAVNLPNKFTTTIISVPWSAPNRDNNGACSDPNIASKSYPDHLLNIDSTFTSDIFVYNPAVITDVNGVPTNGITCQKAGTYYVYFALNKSVKFEYIGYLYYTSNGVSKPGIEWTVPANKYSANKTIQVIMSVGDYIYLQGYCTSTKVNGTLNISTTIPRNIICG